MKGRGIKLNVNYTPLGIPPPIYAAHHSSARPAAALHGTQHFAHRLPWVQTATVSAAARLNIDARAGQSAAAVLDALQTITSAKPATCRKLLTIRARSATAVNVM